LFSLVSIVFLSDDKKLSDCQLIYQRDGEFSILTLKLLCIFATVKRNWMSFERKICRERRSYIYNRKDVRVRHA